MNSKIKAVLFDIGGVLQLKKENSKSIHQYVAKKTNKDIDQYFDSIDDAYSKSIEGKLSEKEVMGILAQNLQTKKEKLKKYYAGAYNKNFNLNKPLLNYAKILKKKGIKIAILSDMWHISKKILIIKEFYKIFNPVILSCDVGIRKPNKKIYLLALSRLRLKPSEVLFIDNQKWNIKPAQKIGMKTILFRTNKQTLREIKIF